MFGYLFNDEKTLLIEEFISLEMADLVGEISGTPKLGILSEAYYKLKALELLYLLFKNLSKRQHIKYQSLRSDEIAALYRVRDALSSSLERPLTQDELVKMSGMNALNSESFLHRSLVGAFMSMSSTYGCRKQQD